MGAESLAPPALDVATFGETMLRLSPPAGFALESAQRLEVSTGGAESNLAAALARLGWRVGWVSRLPDNPLGRRVAREVAAHGVDVSRVMWRPEGKVGLLFIESGAEPRPTRVLYDRAHSAIAELDPAELDYAYLCSARTLFLTGITPALGAGCRAAWLRAAQAAHAAGREVVVDVNYRSKLWGAQTARETIEAVLPHTRALICSLGDAQALFGMPQDPALAAETLRQAYRLPLVVLTLGAQGALACDAGPHASGAPQIHRHPVFPAQVHDRIGSGDAFAAGFLYGWRERDVPYGLRCGCALAALKQTWRGDVAWSGKAELLELVGAQNLDPRRVQR